ncbi:permease family-domain-containing protein [Pseudoneurospora amorphoporcata]|uniref:Permease family-domain-containing protein n=1 Tax=Pseudoneurospora amorphoporcata TaxID=241081 RepID=A0AAN6SI68_9PEZI|nr:permease family-domain-containing protein [Pseudoneurospora amorphoporcata]
MAGSTGVRLSDNLDGVHENPRRSIFRRGIAYATEAINGGVDFVNRKVSGTYVGRFFRLRGSGHAEEIRDANFCTEIRAGLITFSTMLYVLAANPAVIAASGYECSCLGEDKGKPYCARDYSTCVEELRRDMVTVTAAVSAMSCILIGLTTNMPLAVAPGMGLNSYFAYQVVGIRGSGLLPWRTALTAVFLEGWIFIILALTGLRHWLVRIIPTTMKVAGVCGIGLFLALTGLTFNTGLGIITSGNVVPISLAVCDNPNEQDQCTGTSAIASPKLWLGILGGGILPAVLMGFNNKYSIGIGVLFVTLMSIPRSTSVTFFPYDSAGQNKWDYFSSMVGVRKTGFNMFELRFDLHRHQGNFIVALLTMLYVDMIDCTATLQGLARYTYRLQGLDPDFPGSTIAYCTNAFCISMGALLGSSPVTVYVESGAGAQSGGRTGIAAIVTGLCFLAAVFLAPFFSGIPPYATGPALILIGFLMLRQIGSINWNYAGDAIPSFVTIMFIPFSYSVAYGLIAGLFTYIIVNGLIWIISKSTGIEPHDYHLKQYWTINPAGRKPWVYRAYKFIMTKIQKNKGQATEEVPVQEFELMERQASRLSRPRSAVASASTMEDKHSRTAQSPDHLRSD